MLILFLLLLLAACLGSVLFLKSQIRSFAKRWGRQQAGVEVEVDVINWSNYGKKVQLQGLTMFNPAGYATDYAIQIEELVLELDLVSLVRSFGKAITVNDLVCTSVDCNLEQKGGASNLQDILTTLDSRQQEEAAFSEGPSPRSTKEAGDAGSYTILTTNPYAKGGVRQHGVSWAPRCECCHSRVDLRVNTAELTRITGFAARSEAGPGGGFALDDIIVDDFRKTYGDGIKSNGDIARVLLRLLLVASLRSSPASSFYAKGDRRCCGPWAGSSP